MQKWEARWNINHDLARSGTTEVGTEWVALKRREVKDGLSGGNYFLYPDLAGFGRIWPMMPEAKIARERNRHDRAVLIRGFLCPPEVPLT
jgi:hypothetical protein